MRDLKDEVSRLKELLRAQGLGDILDSEFVADSAGHNLLSHSSYVLPQEHPETVFFSVYIVYMSKSLICLIYMLNDHIYVSQKWWFEAAFKFHRFTLLC